MSRSIETLSALTFRLARRRYALALDRTCGVRDLADVRLIPGSPESWYGLIEWSGRVINVLDLPRILGDRGVEKARSVVRLREPFADFALFVPAHLGLAELDVPSSLPSPSPYVPLGSATNALNWINLDALLVTAVGALSR